MGREAPMNPSPAGKPSITARATATPKGKFDVRSGHGTEFAVETGKTSSSGGKPGGSKFVDIYSGHGTEYAVGGK
jgi:hypothetical protein